MADRRRGPVKAASAETAEFWLPLGLSPGFGARLSAWDPLGAGEMPAPLPPTLAESVAGLALSGCRRRPAGWELVYQPELAFTFHVTYGADETREELVSIWIDALRESPADPLDAGHLRPLPWEPGRSPACFRAIPDYVVDRLYKAAQRALAALAAQRATTLEAAAGERAQEDLKRVDAYYDALLQEELAPVRQALHEAAVASVRSQLARSDVVRERFSSLFAERRAAAGEAEQAFISVQERLEVERRRHRTEILARCRARWEARLIAVARVFLPRLVCRWRLFGPSQRDVRFCCDLVRGRRLDLECETCGVPLAQIVLTASGELSCLGCSGGGP